MKRLLHIALLALVAAGVLVADVLFVRSVMDARPMVCDVYRMRADEVGSCLTWIEMAKWGAQ